MLSYKRIFGVTTTQLESFRTIRRILLYVTLRKQIEIKLLPLGTINRLFTYFSDQLDIYSFNSLLLLVLRITHYLLEN